MKISAEGLRLIKSFEGYHTRLQNGDCAAYLCPAKVPTIGYGCTEGVKLGMVWTEAQAEEALLREIAKFEAAVTRLVTVDINQNQADALISFAYNCGEGALAKSGLLRKVNAKDFTGAAKEFSKWTKGGGKVLPGLVARRAREAALFLKPVEAPDAPAMPQAVSKTAEASKTAVAVGAGSVGAIVPAAPDLSHYTAWQNVAETVSGLIKWGVSNPLITGALALWICLVAFGPKLLEKTPWAHSSD